MHNDVLAWFVATDAPVLNLQATSNHNAVSLPFTESFLKW